MNIYWIPVLVNTWDSFEYICQCLAKETSWHVHQSWVRSACTSLNIYWNPVLANTWDSFEYICQCSVSNLTIKEFSSHLQRLWSEYAQAGLRLCWLHIPHCWKSHVAAHMGLGGRKPVFGGLRTTQAQTSLYIHAVWLALCYLFFGKYNM